MWFLSLLTETGGLLCRKDLNPYEAFIKKAIRSNLIRITHSVYL